MTSQPNPVSHSWRRFLRFSVRGLIVVVLVIRAGLRWIVRQAHIQRSAVAALRMAGASVLYDWEWSDGKASPGGESRAPRWLLDMLGVDYFGHVTVVQLPSSPQATDATLAEVGRLTRLEALPAILGRTQVSDAGLVHLKGLTNLSILWLEGTQVTDTGLAHLKGLTDLNSLGLRGTEVTDVGLTRLKGLTKLDTLDLGLTRVTDAGLADLKELTGLSRLFLDGTLVTDAGVKELERALPTLTIYH